MSNKKTSLSQSIGEAYQAIAPYASAGWVFVVSVTVCIALGWWFDSKVGLKPLFTLCGAALGIGIGIYNLIIIAKQIKTTYNKDTKQDTHEL